MKYNVILITSIILNISRLWASEGEEIFPESPKAPATENLPIKSRDNFKGSQPQIDISSERFENSYKRSYEYEEADFSPGFGSSLGLILNGRDFDSLLSLYYHFTPYIASILHFTYEREDDPPHLFISYGHLISLQFHFRNSTILTPFFSTGLGQQNWKLDNDKEDIEKKSSMLISHKFGLNMKLTKHFAIIFQNHLTKYIDKAPINPKNQKRESKNKSDLEIMFTFLI